MKPDELAGAIVVEPGSLVAGPQLVPFDGHRFEWWPPGVNPLPLAFALDLAFRARRGDEAAVDLLNAFGITVTDADRRSYWPPDDGPVVVAGGDGV